MVQIFKLAVLLMVATMAIASGLVSASFSINFAKISEPYEALTQLRRMASAEPVPERCHRMTYLLVQIQRSPLDLTQIARLSQEPIMNLVKSNKNIVFDSLQKFLFSALDSFRLHGILDQAYLDLIDCVEFTFKGKSIQAIRDLARDDYALPAKQLREILDQRAGLLIDPGFVHPTLRYEQLTEPVKRTLLSWFRGNEARAKQHFLCEHDDRIRMLEDRLPEVFEGISDAYQKMNNRWKLPLKCKVYAEFSKYGLGLIERNSVDFTFKTIDTKVTTSHKLPEYTANPDDTQAIIDLSVAAARKKAYEPILLEVIDCLANVFQKEPKAQEFLESPELNELIDELASSLEEASTPEMAAIESDQVASVAEPEEDHHPNEPDDISDDEEEEDEDEEEPEGEEGPDEGEEEEEGEGEEEEEEEEGEEAAPEGEQAQPEQDAKEDVEQNNDGEQAQAQATSGQQEIDDDEHEPEEDEDKPETHQ